MSKYVAQALIFLDLYIVVNLVICAVFVIRRAPTLTPLAILLLLAAGLLLAGHLAAFIGGRISKGR